MSAERPENADSDLIRRMLDDTLWNLGIGAAVGVVAGAVLLPRGEIVRLDGTRRRIGLLYCVTMRSCTCNSWVATPSHARVYVKGWHQVVSSSASRHHIDHWSIRSCLLRQRHVWLRANLLPRPCCRCVRRSCRPCGPGRRLWRRPCVRKVQRCPPRAADGRKRDHPLRQRQL